jgi:hypothetical protein
MRVMSRGQGAGDRCKSSKLDKVGKQTKGGMVEHVTQHL